MSAKGSKPIDEEHAPLELLYTVPKKEIDDSLYIFHDTFFSLAKKSGVGSDNESLTLTEEEFVTFKLLQGVDTSITAELSLFSKERMQIVHMIKLFYLGIDPEKLYEISKRNPYFNLLFPHLMKKLHYTKERIDCYLEIEHLEPIYDVDGNTPLMSILLKTRDKKQFDKLIDKFPESVVEPNYINPGNGNTALINSTISVIFTDDKYFFNQLIGHYRDSLNINHINKNGNTAFLIVAKYSVGDKASLINMITTYDVDLEVDVIDFNGETAYSYLMKKPELNTVSMMLLKQYGESNFPTVELQKIVFDYLFTNRKEEQFRMIIKFPCMRKRAKELFNSLLNKHFHRDNPFHVSDTSDSDTSDYDT